MEKLQLRYSKRRKEWKFKKPSILRQWNYVKQIDGQVQLTSKIHILGGSLILSCNSFKVEGNTLYLK